VTVAIWIQTAVLAATAALVWWYTRETALLRKEMVRQNRLALRPIVVPEFSVDNSQAPPTLQLTLSNVGHGCASNIRLLPLSVPDEYLKQMNFPPAQVHFSETAYLAGGGKAEVSFRLISEGKALPHSVFREFFFPLYPGPEVNLVVSFSDVEGGRYRIKVTVEAEQDETKLPRRVGIGPVEQYSERSADR